MAFQEVTTPNRPWLTKLLAFLVVTVLVGGYFLYDGSVAYPARGKRYASFLQFQYLQAAQQETMLPTQISVEHPVDELKRLKDLGAKATAAEGKRLEWLEALAVVNHLKPEFTAMSNPAETLQKLQAEWTTSKGARNAPKPLSSYDIKVQLLIAGVCLFVAAMMLVHILRTVAKKYRWDAETKTLQLPDGSTLSPADIEDFDKRKWDKFLIFLKVKPGHAKHGGKELKLDLYQHAPLETWILAMEQAAFPDRVPPAAPPEAPAA